MPFDEAARAPVGGTADDVSDARTTVPTDRYEAAARRAAAAARARRIAAELAADASACQRRAEALRRDLEARRLQTARM
ncbi:hypothetical protein [Geodermatophilus nigrescens]|uniref:hypothetical protein n=1 Tax=Geodermatophilus nigrescens TaxID=1070870 RepID=UPI0011148DAC|nr:hypothetical protein [Geodermatophilus nigrescens]